MRLFQSRGYEDRKVDRFEKGELVISTAAVEDGTMPYETAIKHPDYNDGKWIIVEAYETRAKAQAGHLSWVTLMIDEPLPPSLTDCANSDVSNLMQAIGGDLTYPRNRRN